jgi:G2/mitotic-specific cyclin-B, other
VPPASARGDFSAASAPEPQTEQKSAPSAVASEFAKRLEKLALHETTTDKLNAADPQHVSGFAQAIFKELRKAEKDIPLQPDYLSKVQLASEVKDTSRAFLVEWIIDVHRKFRLKAETLYTTVYVIDRYLSLKQIRKTQLHILGVSALLIATKYEEIYPPDMKDLLQVSENKFTRAEVLQMELDILSVLEFQVTAPSAYRFLERMHQIAPLSLASDEIVFFFAQYIQEISLLDASLLKYRPSEIAAASLILATKSLKPEVQVWTSDIEQWTGMLYSELSDIAEDVRGFVVEVNPKFLTTLKYKFSKKIFGEVAALPFKF